MIYRFGKDKFLENLRYQGYSLGREDPLVKVLGASLLVILLSGDHAPKPSNTHKVILG